MRFPNPLSIIPAAIGLIFAFPAYSSGQAYYTESGHVEFHSDVPLHSFTGVSDHLVGKINLADSTVDFYVDINTLDTGIGMRDDDMRETLQAKQYPFASFYGTLVSGFNASSNQPQSVRVEGDFSIHGRSQPIAVEGTLQKTGKGLKLTASWSLNMRDYDIKPPGILFYRVSEIVDISIEALLTPK